MNQFKRPWVYMGPGLFFDGAGRIHIRLSHTANNVPGMADYDGGTDPRQLRLAISRLPAGAAAWSRTAASCVSTIWTSRFGGDRTIRIETADDVCSTTFGSSPASDGIRLGDDDNRVVFRHCEVLGGIPTWMFRSDIKDGYRFMVGDTVVTNDLGHGTSQTLLFGVASDVETVVHNCEFVDGT